MQGEEIEQDATIDASQTPTAAVTEPSAVSIYGPYATTDDSKGDENFAPPAQGTPGKGGSRVAGSATPEVYPPTPRQGSLNNTNAHAKVQRMQTKLEKPSTADLPACPEEVPIKDPWVTDRNETGSQADDRPAFSTETQHVPNFFGDEPSSDQSCPAPQTTPGAVAVAGIDYSDGEASDIELMEDSRGATLQAPVGAHVVNDRGHGTGTTRNSPRDELLREHILADAPLISAEAVQDLPESPDADITSPKLSPMKCLRRTWAILALLVAIILASGILMGVFIPQESAAASQEDIQGNQPSATPSSIPTSCPSHLPLLTPTFHPETLRFRAIQSILELISGLQVLLDTSAPQYHALE